MILILNKPYIIFFLFFLIFNQEEEKCKREIEVEIIHPGIGQEPVSKKLVQSHCKSDELYYYMDVESVVCGDQQCRIDTVRIFWDELGFYKSMEVRSEYELEKKAGMSFDNTDYLKLDKILKDRESGLKEAFADEIVANQSGNGVDATSGATINLHNKDYVKGAVWTCYTLWHWVNGDAYEIIRNLSGKSLSADELRTYLSSDSCQWKIFALEQLIRRKNYKSETIQLVLRTRVLDNHWGNLVVDYIKELPSDSFFMAISSLLQADYIDNKLLYLDTLLKTEKSPPIGYFDKLSYLLLDWNSYPLINSFLNILENKDIQSPEISARIIQLLKNKNFLIARRAYWFLKDQNLTTSQRRDLDNFFIDHEDRL